jgi:RHS repeat-associated protein
MKYYCTTLYNSYDAWGSRSLTYNAAQYPEYILDRGYTGHEHLDDFNLINMNGRMYDPVLGRMLSPDNVVQNPYDAQNYNRYSYCLNNPLMYTDPSGELYLIDDLIVGGVGFAFGYVSYGITHGDWGWNAVGAGGIGAGVALLSYYTAGGFSLAAGGSLSGCATFAGNYAISSAVNSFMPGVTVPITDNFSVSMSMGLGVSSSGLGAGFNVSGNYSNGDFSASLGFGAGEGATGSYSGWGASARYNDWGAGYSRTNYTGAHSQVVGGATLFLGKDVSFRLENDFFGDRHDRWRSNAFELTIGDFVFGSNLYNNEVDVTADPDLEGGMLLNNSCNRSPFGAWRDGKTYSSPLWVGFKMNGSVYRFGYSHPLVQDRTQNVIHKWFGPGRTNFFNNYDYFQYGTYNYYGYNNPYSLW